MVKNHSFGCKGITLVRNLAFGIIGVVLLFVVPGCDDGNKATESKSREEVYQETNQEFQETNQKLQETINCYRRKATEQGDANAQCILGIMYENGLQLPKSLGVTNSLELVEVVPKSIEEATKWYRKAAEQGNKEAKEALSRLQSGNQK